MRLQSEESGVMVQVAPPPFANGKQHPQAVVFSPQGISIDTQPILESEETKIVYWKKCSLI